MIDVAERLKLVSPFTLRSDLADLSENERRLLPFLKQAAAALDLPYWIQEYGDPASLADLKLVPEVDRYVRLNYGPWDRLHGNEPILRGTAEKPAGANYYPHDITREEFEEVVALEPALKSPYTMIRRSADGGLHAIPYHQFFGEHVKRAAAHLTEAAALAESAAMKRFLELRAQALLSDEYRASDFAWMALHESSLTLLIGPMEIEDRLFGIKRAYSAAILMTEKKASTELSHYVARLGQFQDSLPVPERYKQERPRIGSDLQVCDAIHFAGLDACTLPAGVAWPDDEVVRQEAGMRSLLLANVIRAKFEKLFLPIADLLIAVDQRAHVTYDGRFTFVLLHELAHGLGIRYTLAERQPVREALGTLHHPLEEGKADLVALWLASRLHRWGALHEGEVLAIYVTALVSLFYSYDARQSVLRLNFFKEMGAYSRDAKTGRYRVHLERMEGAITVLVEQLLRLQGDGVYENAQEFLSRYAEPDEELQCDIDRMDAARLPVALVLHEVNATEH